MNRVAISLKMNFIKIGQLSNTPMLGLMGDAPLRFKALLVRFEFSARNWMSLHFMAFSVIFLRKISKKQKV